jgi:cell division septum initiation protein DivIVA
MNSVNRDSAATNPTAEIDAPAFAQVFRGYDKDSVDVFVRVIGQRLATERQRGDRAEAVAHQLREELAVAGAASAPPSFESLGAEAAKVLEQAGQSATVLLAEAKVRAAALVKEAEEKAAAILEAAQHRSDEADVKAQQTLAEVDGERNRVLDAAREEAERTRSEADEAARTSREEAKSTIERQHRQALEERNSVEADIERMRDYRDRIRTHLAQVHGDLATLLDAATAKVNDGGPTEEEPEATEVVAAEEPATATAAEEPVATTAEEPSKEAEAQVAGGERNRRARGQQEAPPPSE